MDTPTRLRDWVATTAHGLKPGDMAIMLNTKASDVTTARWHNSHEGALDWGDLVVIVDYHPQYSGSWLVRAMFRDDPTATFPCVMDCIKPLSALDPRRVDI
jgi:hypothetical protein